MIKSYHIPKMDIGLISIYLYGLGLKWITFSTMVFRETARTFSGEMLQAFSLFYFGAVCQGGLDFIFISTIFYIRIQIMTIFLPSIL